MDKMFLSVKELAVKLSVSEKTIYRMVNESKIPYTVKLGGQWRFNKEKIDKWLASDRTFDRDTTEINNEITLRNSFMEFGNVIRVFGSDRDEMLNNALLEVNRFKVADIMKIKKNIFSKESIISSSINEIAFMIVDYDSTIELEKSMFLIIYLDSPTDFKALDQRKTKAVMLIIPSNKTEELILNTRLRGLFMVKEFTEAVKNHECTYRILEIIESFENGNFYEN